MSTFDTFGLWWMIMATIVSVVFTAVAVSNGRMTMAFGSYTTVWSILYILFYLHLLGVIA